MAGGCLGSWLGGGLGSVLVAGWLVFWWLAGWVYGWCVGGWLGGVTVGVRGGCAAWVRNRLLQEYKLPTATHKEICMAIGVQHPVIAQAHSKPELCINNRPHLHRGICRQPQPVRHRS